ncbi:flagellar protein FlhE [Pantoea sp. BS_4]|uniref:Flagellar protein flhE n=1 Tax=Pantoea stewartii TaxID=66269 RepID=A0AB34VKU7_9GAMM|nr:MULTISPECIES: flagellar protein FlhE [Pantoea]KKW52075.1 flagellar protein flhE [Pantoea ananatis]KGD81321.1 flagellar protein flhE [Pantoea stewartii subsp. indologenes]KTS27656.1 flagellar protein flhE [Pantoea stewartii]KTS74295.1 flagellar protein flhE [Pantoea stewartii]KTT01001.1 flagellar protein flhE [Pantoea stewartii]
MRSLMLFSLLLPLFAQAADGAWSASAAGPLMANRGSWQSSQPLTPPGQVSGAITVVNWRYQFTQPVPSGLQVRLCAEQRCTELDGASGSTRGLAEVAAGETLHMVFGFAGGGSLPPGLKVVSTAVTVNYH